VERWALKKKGKKKEKKKKKKRWALFTPSNPLLTPRVSQNGSNIEIWWK
jgi:hypothetical protein